ncbi:MAG: acetyl-CoA carboxylase biotin carboxylase subunit [Parvibaculaceae bacterium]
MIASLLIANRGEIACRIIRTAKRLGLRTIAVYSDADADALHVSLANEAVRIGPAPARESYLDIAAVIDAARQTKAEAIHPGYGFLSENANFAEACAKAKIIFVGPPASAIRAMGGKSEAKALMAKAQVPLVPGYHGTEQGPAKLLREAEKIGFPLLIKASAGGGGKGMKIAESAADFPDQLASAKREALSSFNDERVLIEKYLTRPRHVEIQVFADSHGNCIHLFERDCSIQRRHQKVIEEAPAPGMTDALRARMGEAAVKAAQAIGYSGAGTVEFLLDRDGSFYFMEMNTRLQVEHPVTEFITGLDLVEWQLRVASGEKLPSQQSDLRINGHAIEVRLYAEDADKGFLPQTGRITHLRWPENARIDTGIAQGKAISTHYDPMIAKLIVWDRDRASALAQLRRALQETEISGIVTNAPFLLKLASHKAFAKADLDTGFIARHETELLPSVPPASEDVLTLAAIGLVLSERTMDASPWSLGDGWRHFGGGHDHVTLIDQADQSAHKVPFVYAKGGFVFGKSCATATLANGRLTATIGSTRHSAGFARSGDDITLFLSGIAYRFKRQQLVLADGAEAGALRLTAPMPGRIIAVHVKAGQSVARGAPLLVLEAMKMEHALKAAQAGTIAQVSVKTGEQIREGQELLRFAEPKD